MTERELIDLLFEEDKELIEIKVLLVHLMTRLDEIEEKIDRL